MIIGVYQFAVSKNIAQNMDAIQRGVALAAKESARLLVFPECALTGYPTHEARSSDVDIHAVEECFCKLQKLASQYAMHLLVGSVTKHEDVYRNSAVLFTPGAAKAAVYSKRALWGWDLRNFTEGSPGGIWPVDELKVGVRICFEVRFPEYFRELYRADVNLAVVMFNDVSETDDVERYGLIKSHLQTRAAENVCTVLSVNDASKYQTAPTAVIDNDGKVLRELARNADGLLVFDYQVPELSFSGRGRKAVSDRLAI